MQVNPGVRAQTGGSERERVGRGWVGGSSWGMFGTEWQCSYDNPKPAKCHPIFYLKKVESCYVNFQPNGTKRVNPRPTQVLRLSDLPTHPMRASGSLERCAEVTECTSPPKSPVHLHACDVELTKGIEGHWVSVSKVIAAPPCLAQPWKLRV